MFQLVYVSSATKPLIKSELVDLLSTCRKNNTQRGVTGLLLYKDGNFMQALEGEESVVRDLYGKICRDSRHSGMLILLDATLAIRQFPDWSMGFRDLNDPEVHAMPGFSQLMNPSFIASDFIHEPGKARLLLDFFRQSR